MTGEEYGRVTADLPGTNGFFEFVELALFQYPYYKLFFFFRVTIKFCRWNGHTVTPHALYEL